jgi:hypothetical protein
MSLDDLHSEQIEAQLRQTRLCALVVESILEGLTDPTTPDSRADLLLAAEQLALDVVQLVDKARALAWNEPAHNFESNTFL